jgi:hypothetical protein
MVAGQAQASKKAATSVRHFVPISRQRATNPGRTLAREMSCDSGQRIKGKAMAFGVLGEGIRLVLEQVENCMLSRCANSQCSKPFLKLREGKLFLVETERLNKPGEAAAPPFVRARQLQRQVEHYWLCDECAAQWTLVYDRDRGIALAPLRRPVASVPAVDALHSEVA